MLGFAEARVLAQLKREDERTLHNFQWKGTITTILQEVDDNSSCIPLVNVVLEEPNIALVLFSLVVNYSIILLLRPQSERIQQHP